MTRTDTNRTVTLQKMARAISDFGYKGITFGKKQSGLSAVRYILAFVFANAKCRFSRDSYYLLTNPLCLKYRRNCDYSNNFIRNKQTSANA